MPAKMSRIKEARLNIRANAHQKEVISRAAQLRNMTMSHFMLKKAYEDAQSILAEESHFKLSSEEWKKFCEILDRKPRNITSLQKLLIEPDVFEDD